MKIAVFFVVPYRVRRRSIDEAYGDKTSATRYSDPFLLLFVLLLLILLFVRGTEVVSFLTGLLVGATLIQLYFHSFSEPLNPEKAPKPPISPIKMMSYAIQARPSRLWRELTLIVALIAWALYRIAHQTFG